MLSYFWTGLVFTTAFWIITIIWLYLSYLATTPLSKNGNLINGRWLFILNFLEPQLSEASLQAVWWLEAHL